MMKSPLNLWCTQAVLLSLGGLVLLSACGSDATSLSASFETPTGLAVAGSAKQYLFVANRGQDTLQILEVGKNLSQVDFVRSTAQFFPLRIPAGPSPSRLAATPDGRYVVVLNEADDTLRLIDADALKAATDAEGNPVTLVLDPKGARPTDMVASIQSCAAPCVGLVYVSLPGLGSIAEVAISEIQTNGAFIAALVTQRMISVLGEPMRMALTRDGQTLYATDAANQEVIRLNLIDDSSTRANIGAFGGAIALSTDDLILLVGRPSLRDILFLNTDLSVIDADPFFAPAPKCVPQCGDAASETLCQDAHVADLAICITDPAVPPSGLAVSPTFASYGAIFLDTIPVEITTLGAGAGQPPMLERTCGTGPTRTGYEEFAVVAGADGLLRFVGLSQQSVIAPELMQESWCTTPSMAPLAGTPYSVSDVLTECPAMPGRQRFSCACHEGACGIGLLPGITGTKTVIIDWEGVLVDQSSGGGVVTDTGHFFDINLDLGTKNILPGDILDILTEPNTSAQCLVDLAGGAQRSDLERTIQSVTPVDGQTQLTLDCPTTVPGCVRPLPTSCFSKGGAIGYLIRAGNQFVVTTNQERRLSPGEQFGPGLGVGHDEALLFGLRQNVSNLPRTDPTDPKPGFLITDPFKTILSGWSLDNNRNPQAFAVGRLPAAMTVMGASDNPIVFVSYAGSGTDSLLGFVPFDLDTSVMIAEDNYRLIR